MAGLVPAISLSEALQCPGIEIAGTSPAMTKEDKASKAGTGTASRSLGPAVAIAGRRRSNSWNAALLDRGGQKARRAHVVDEAIDLGERLRLVLRYDDRLRHVEDIVRQQPIAGQFRRQIGQPLPVCAERIDLAIGELPLGVGRWVVGFDQRRLLERARQEQRDRIAFSTPDAPTGLIDIGNRSDR